ncbi:hypothetical protein BAE44_0025197, partial [Dichanthelium oligosanthes]
LTVWAYMHLPKKFPQETKKSLSG